MSTDLENRSRRRKFFAQSTLYIPAVVGPALIGVVTLAVLTRLLPPAGYGEYALAIGVATAVTGIVGEWLTAAAIRFYPDYEKSQDVRLLKQNVLVLSFAAAAVGAVVIAPLVAVAASLSFVFAAVSLGVVWTLSRAVWGVMRARFQAKRFAIVSIVTAGAALAIGIAIFVATDAAVSFVWGSVAAYGAGVVLLLAWEWRAEVGSIVKGASRTHMGTLARFGLPIALTAIGSQALFLGDRFLLALLRTEAEVGLYAPSYNIAERLIGFAFAPLFGAVYPLAAREWANENRESTVDYLETADRSFVILGGFVTTIVIVFGNEVVGLFLGSEFAEGARIAGIVAIGVFLWYEANLFHQVLELSKRTATITLLVLVTAVVNVALNLVLIPPHGFVGAAWATLISYFIYAVLSYLWGLKSVGTQVRLSLDTVARVAVFGAGLWALREALEPSETLALVIAACSFPVLIAWLYLTREPALKSIVSVLRKRQES